MPKRITELFVIDSLVAMNKITRYHTGFSNAQDFYYDDKSFDATMRELQIIGEATKHLIASNFLSTEYRIIVDFRNLIVHEYFGIDADEIWNILHHELPPFKETIYDTLKKFDKKILLQIVDDTKNDYRGDTAHFLDILYNYINLNF